MGNFTSREKQIVLGGGLLALIFICIQFIYLTGSDNWVNREQAKSLSAFAFLVKPYEASDLLSAVQLALAASAGTGCADGCLAV